LLAGTIIQGTPYVAVYNNSDGAWYLQNFYGNPYNVPLGAGMDYWLPTAPNSSFVFPTGQAISRTSYATLFALMGTTYGTGDGSTTFNLPDKTGRISAMKEASATRLTSTYFGGNSANLGAVGGLESSTLLTANLPPYTPAGAVANGAIFLNGNTSTLTPGGSVNAICISSPNGGGTLTAIAAPSQAASSFAGTAQGGTSTPVRTVPPTIVCNYILRII
jgi:microcystin-dependent protein